MGEKYDLNDLGYKYKGIASVKSKTIKLGPWTIIDVPEDVNDEKARSFVRNFIKKIVAVEIPTSLVCNLRCEYCYIDDPRMKNKKVTKDQVWKILEYCSELFPGLSKDKKIRENVNKKAVAHLSPWGAEPFMNISTLETLYEFAHKYYGKDNYKINTSTNGTIWNERVKQLFINLINDNAFKSIQVSLDGPKFLQDKARPTVDGKGSFESIKQFIFNLKELAKELNIKRKLHTFCSTIHLSDDNFVENWLAAAEFFSTPNTWHTSLPVLPMRMSGEDMQTSTEIEKFIKAQSLMLELVKKRAKEGITVADFYSYKLFGDFAAHSKNAFPYCSALNTQIGIDIDGSLYPCHGPITTPTYKPFLWFGNLFDKVISYKLLYRNFSYQYGTLWTKGKCSTCPIYNYATGNVCWSCPSHNLAITGEPSMDSVLRCMAYTESFKYWIEIAKITLDNPLLNDIPADWYNNLSEFNKTEFKNKKLKVFDEKIHFDMNYDGMIANAIERFDIMLRDKSGYLKLTDKWWKMDDYYEKSISNLNDKVDIKKEVEAFTEMLKQEINNKRNKNV